MSKPRWVSENSSRRNAGIAIAPLAETQICARSCEGRRAHAMALRWADRFGYAPLVRRLAVVPLLVFAVTVLSGSVLSGSVLGGSVARDVPAAIADAARNALTMTPTLTRDDCSGLVMSVLASAGVPHTGDSRSFWTEALDDARAFEVGEPAPGDLAFFDRTFDKNRNGLVDDELTHIAIVTAIHADGLVELVHRERSGVRLLRLHLARPDEHRDGERVLNSYLRAAGYGDTDTPRLAGELLRGFARPPSP